MTVPEYLQIITKRYELGNATEHTFRGELTQLIESLVPTIRATNEPKRQACGAPDYILTKNDIPVGYIEAKDIGDKDLSGLKKNGNKPQFDRYKASLENCIYTDYLEFNFYLFDQFITKISIGVITDVGIKPLKENFSAFENLIKNFCSYVGQTIKSSKQLAEMMAGKARLLSDIIERSLNSDETNREDSTLKDQMTAFKDVLIHDITPKGFADVYAQTIAYGMFAARLHDPTLPTFSRQEAAELIPKSNPFLRKLFGYIAGPDIDDRIKWVVDSLVEIFLACDVEKLLKNYGKATKMEDPIIHFYETFLSEYDSALRKARGVWYTPTPVVDFIVRALDDILKMDFGLTSGLADTSKTTVKVKHLVKATADMRSKTKELEKEQEIHRVQILDPATGTGTFLAEVVKHIYKRFKGQQGIWSNYVDLHLLPRLNGFELLMASYAMAHLKLDLLLNETGYKPDKEQRLKVYLTNSLEEHHPDTGTLFANWLSSEANEANRIKRDTPVMCVIGNPPYSVSSNNKSPWIERLTADYKKDLNERNIQPLSDDYIKFIRFGQYFIDKNGSGVLAYISNNSFLDGMIHRQMRKNLLQTFDSIYILDLHGNSKKKETAPDGSADQNVFDIMQGVSINIFVKTGKKHENELARLYHFDLHGKRDFKYKELVDNSIKSLKWNILQPFEPDYFFVRKDFKESTNYKLYFPLNELFPVNSVGVVTSRDAVLVGNSTNSLKKQVESCYKIESNARLIRNFDYRPFDTKFIYYDVKLIDRARDKVMSHMSNANIALSVPKQAIKGFQHTFIGTNVCDKNYIDSAGQFGAGNVFPLYLYQEKNKQLSLTQSNERKPNLNLDILSKFEKVIGAQFVTEKEAQGNVCFANDTGIRPEFRQTFAPIDILDYVYAVLHSPAYREKYQEFLKIDFPRIPYPKDAEMFWRLVKLGGEIRQIHLLESPVVEHYITQYPINGDNVVEKPEYKNGNVYINETQLFAGVPLTAWEFYIGGYQPAQKWLKDRKGKVLDFEEILHYQKIIVALEETNKTMKEIDKIEFIQEIFI